MMKRISWYKPHGEVHIAKDFWSKAGGVTEAIGQTYLEKLNPTNKSSMIIMTEFGRRFFSR